jgi:PhnB protein
MTVAPYLLFNGNCKEAFEFYEKVLGGKIEHMMTFAESPMPAQGAAGTENLIMHVSMTIGNAQIMASDCPPEYFEKAQGMSVTLGIETVEEAERIFNALAEDATIKMPLEETFWARRFGMLTDRFGTPWMINCTAPAAS